MKKKKIIRKEKKVKIKAQKKGKILMFPVGKKKGKIPLIQWIKKKEKIKQILIIIKDR